MKNIKKPNYKKWVKSELWSWWEFICLMTEIEPPKDFPEYMKLRSTYKPLKNKEEEFRQNGFFKDFNCPDPNDFH